MHEVSCDVHPTPQNGYLVHSITTFDGHQYSFSVPLVSCPTSGEPHVYSHRQMFLKMDVSPSCFRSSESVRDASNRDPCGLVIRPICLETLLHQILTETCLV